jgi:cholesterol 24(S)-hydroxylase
LTFQVAFNVDLNAVQDKNCPFLLANYLVLKGIQESFKDMLWRFNVFMYPFQWKAIKAVKFIREYSRKVIEERINDIQEGKDTPNDILQHIVLMIKGNSSVTLEELVDDFVTFFIAGKHNNCAMSVCLSVHPSVRPSMQKL